MSNDHHEIIERSIAMFDSVSVDTVPHVVRTDEMSLSIDMSWVSGGEYEIVVYDDYYNINRNLEFPLQLLMLYNLLMPTFDMDFRCYVRNHHMVIEKFGDGFNLETMTTVNYGYMKRQQQWMTRYKGESLDAAMEALLEFVREMDRKDLLPTVA